MGVITLTSQNEDFSIDHWCVVNLCANLSWQWVEDNATCVDGYTSAAFSCEIATTSVFHCFKHTGIPWLHAIKQ